MNKGFTKLFGQAVLVGLLTGVVVVLFKLGIDTIFHFVIQRFYACPLIFLLVTTLGGLISGLLVCKLAPETAGSGIPYVKMSLLKSGKLIRIRTIFVKFFAGVIQRFYLRTLEGSGLTKPLVHQILAQNLRK